MNGDSPREGALFIVTHTDLDGVGSAAAALRVTGRSLSDVVILYAEPYNVHEALEIVEEHASKGDTLLVSDLGPNRDSFPRAIETIRRLVEEGVNVEWYDHHIWSREDQEALRAAGAYLALDTSTCATGVVVHYASRRRGLEPDDFLLELERAVCAADLWRWDHYLAPKLFRVADSRYEEGREAWRNRLVEKFSNGIIWDEELEEKLVEYVDLELKNYNSILRTTYVTGEPCRVAAASKKRGPPSNSFLGASLQSRYNADIAVIIRDNGGMSLRSRNVNVQKIAVELGGGGHPRAAGARIKIPFTVRLLSIIFGRRMLSRYAARKVREVALKLGICG